MGFYSGFFYLELIIGVFLQDKFYYWLKPQLTYTISSTTECCCCRVWEATLQTVGDNDGECQRRNDCHRTYLQHDTLWSVCRYRRRSRRTAAHESDGSDTEERAEATGTGRPHRSVCGLNRPQQRTYRTEIIETLIAGGGSWWCSISWSSIVLSASGTV